MPVEKAGSGGALRLGSGAKFRVRGDPGHCLSHFGHRIGGETQSGIACDLFKDWRRGAGGGNSGRERFKQREAESFEAAGGNECVGTFEELVEFGLRNPAGELDARIETKFLTEVFQRPGREAAQTGHNEPEFGAPAMEFRERFEQPLNILVGVQRRYGQQKRVRCSSKPAPLADAEKFRVDTVVNDRDPAGGGRIVTGEIRRGRLRYSDQRTRAAGRHTEKEIPEGQIEPPEKLGVAFVLQIVEDGDGAIGEGHWSGKARVEQDVDAISCKKSGQRDLLIKQTARPKSRVHTGLDGMKTWRRGNLMQAGSCVQVDEIFIRPIDLR